MQNLGRELLRAELPQAIGLKPRQIRRYLNGHKRTGRRPLLGLVEICPEKFQKGQEFFGFEQVAALRTYHAWSRQRKAHLLEQLALSSGFPQEEECQQ